MGILWPGSNQVVWTNGGGASSAGVRAAGAKLYFYESGTTTPRSSYQDAALATPHTVPVVADAYGRMPAVFLDFGDYRERVRTSGNTTIWDVDGVPNPVPFTADLNVDPDALLNTGDVWFSFKDGTRNGAVRCNGRSIGSATSGASERANSDCADLFTFFYDNLSNTICPVSGGRGSNAAADFAANKTLGLPDLRGSVPGGLDTMGNSAASRFDASVPFSVGSATVAGSVAGLNHHALTTAQLASHSHSFSATTSSDGAHTHTFSATTGTQSADHTHSGSTSSDGAHGHFTNDAVSKVGQFSAGGSNGWAGATTSPSSTDGSHQHTFTTGGVSASHTHSVSGTTSGVSATHTHSISGTTGTAGTGDNHNNTPRTVLGTWYARL